MKLLKCIDQNKDDETATEEVSSDTNAEQLKQLGWTLCREIGVLNATWIQSSKSWQELSSIGSDGKAIIHFVIRP